MHTRHLNEQMVRVLKTIGYDVGFWKGRGQYLYDRDGDALSRSAERFWRFCGRPQPSGDSRQALKSVLDADLPNLVQMDVSTLAGILAERLLAHVPHLDKVFFANSGAESVEAAIKFARGATGRPGIVYCGHAFHGLTYGALSLNGDENLPRAASSRCCRIASSFRSTISPRWSRRCRRAQVAAFIVEPIQGKGVILPTDELSAGRAAALPPLRHAVHRRRDPDRHRAHRQIPRRASTGTSSPTWCCSPRRCPAATCRSARC